MHLWLEKESKLIKIAIFHCGFIYTGGGERIVIEEILGLRKYGYLVDCFVPIYDPRLSYPDIIKDLGIKTFLPQLPSFMPFRFGILMVLSCLLSPFLAYRFIKYDLILGANQPGAFIAWVVSKLLRKPYFVYLSQPNRILYPRDHENWQNIKDYYLLNKVINMLFKPLVSFLDRKSITGGKNLFINGSFVAKEICRIYKPKSWIDCPGGAHIPSRSILKVNRLVGKTKMNGFTIERPYLLLTSRHEPWKKFNWVIEAIKLVVADYPKIKLIIPGAETAITPGLRRLVKSLKISQNVIFLGTITQKDLWKLYEQAAIYVFPSPKEDLGIVVIEAQAYGLPVVAWNCGGPTVTVVDGKTGYFAKPYSIPDFAQKICLILLNRHRRNEMGQNAWEHVKTNFSWKKHLDILEGELKKYS